jgi:cellulose biosynthesis protein BcsQ
MKTIAVSVQKGGVGKISLSVSLAAELATLSGATLLIDADPQGNASAWIGEETINAELADVLLDRTVLEKAIVKTGAPGLFLLPTAGFGGDLKTFYNKVIVNAIDGRIRQHGEVLTAIKDNADSGLKIYEVPVDPAFRLVQRKHLTLQGLTAVKQDTRAALSAITADIK